MTVLDVIKRTFEDIGLASYVFDITPEELESARQKLKSMLAEWTLKGVRIGFNADGELSDESGLPDYSIDAISTNLGLRIAPSYGKAMSLDQRGNARNAFDWLLSVSAKAPERKIPAGVPYGAGNKRGYTQFTPQPDENIQPGPDSELNF